MDDPSFSLHGLISSALMKPAHGASLLSSMKEGGREGLEVSGKGNGRKEKDLVARGMRES